jgi:hypothetical protein
MTAHAISPTNLLYFLFFGACCATIAVSRNTDRLIPRCFALYLAGLLLLPNQDYSLSAVSTDYRSVFAYWFFGGALPSDTFVTKAFIVPASILSGLLLLAPKYVWNSRFTRGDIFVLVWISMPLVSMFTTLVPGDALAASLYLAGSWGASWILGRSLMATTESLKTFIQYLSFSGALMAPLALFEFFFEPSLYDIFFQAHPFTTDGAVRYVGFRPLLFLENGNQYGLWIAIATLCGVWRYFFDSAGKTTQNLIVLVVTATMAFISQAVGALLLLSVAVFGLYFWQRLNMRYVLTACAFLLLSIACVYVFGAQQIEYLTRNTFLGQTVLELFRSAGRGSLPWRVSQDLQALSLVKPHFLIGLGHWDWWRPSGTRPWGFHQLTVGMYGLIGLMCVFGVLLSSSVSHLWKSLNSKVLLPIGATALAAFIALISFADMFLNSFVFYPAIVLSGAMLSLAQPIHGNGGSSKWRTSYADRLPLATQFFSRDALRRFDSAYVVAALFLVGWLILPSYFFPLTEMPKSGVFAIWVLGSSVPSLDLISKAWLIPVSLLIGVCLFDRKRILLLNWKWPDFLMFVWCSWPMIQEAIGTSSEPSGAIQSTYLFGAWGSPWILGRLYFSSASAHLKLIKTLCFCSLLYFPVSIVEGIWGPMLHEFFFSAHPFRYDGHERYLGYRPIGLLEHGNQFGAWTSLTAIGAVWLARLAVGPRAILFRIQALIVCLMALAAQSVGALALASLGILLLFTWDSLNGKLIAAALLTFICLFVFKYLMSPDFSNWLWSSSDGQSLVEATKAIGRGSLPWRVWADQSALTIGREHWVIGTGTWDWWQKANIRPWGLPQLLFGQYGLIGVFLSGVCLSVGAMSLVYRAEKALARRPTGAGLVLSILLILALADSLLNSFVYFPIFLIAGALAASATSVKQPSSNR